MTELLILKQAQLGIVITKFIGKLQQINIGLQLFMILKVSMVFPLIFLKLTNGMLCMLS